MERLLKFDDLRAVAISKSIAEVDAYRDGWQDRHLLKVDILSELKVMSSVQSIGSSTRIEGSTLTDSEIAALIKNLEITSLASRDEQEVAGYAATLKIIYEAQSFLDFGRSNVLTLHKELLRFSHRDERHRGAYKQHSNRVVATDAAGVQRTIFRTTEPLLVEPEMDALFAWYEGQLAEPTYHPLVTIATVVYEFLSIHPFQDGNGRLSRLVTTWLLLRHGYSFIPYASFERVIERHKPDYYRHLMSGQRYRGTEHEVISSWVLFFTKSLLELTQDLEKNIKELESGRGRDGNGDSTAPYDRTPTPPTRLSEQRVPVYLSVKEEKVLTYFDRHDYLSVAEVDALVPQVSRSSTKNYLRRLVETGHLRRRGKGRATVYERVR